MLVGDSFFEHLGGYLAQAIVRWDAGAWGPLLASRDVVFQGISGDTVRGIIPRIHLATACQPRILILLAGVNDLGMRSRPPVDVVTSYRCLIARIREESPKTRIVVQSIAPTARPRLNEKIRRCNALLAGLVGEMGATYLDLWPALADEAGTLQRHYTTDGVHLSHAGLARWADLLLPVVVAPLAPV